MSIGKFCIQEYHFAMLLTIGIPTYNRNKEILELTRFIKKQIITNHLTDKVSIVISSNGMAEETLSELKSIKTDLNMSILVNNRNLGYDLNVLNIFKNSNSKYVLLMSDDDIISENLLESILRVIENLSSDHIIICNQELYEDNFKRNIGQEEFFKLLRKDYPYLLAELNFNCEFFGGISGLVLPTERVKNLQLSEFIGTNWIQLAICFKLIKELPIYIPSQGKVNYRLNNPNRTWKVLDTNISLRYVYKRFAQLDKNFIKYGYSKYDRAVKSDMFNSRRIGRINNSYYLGGVNKNLFQMTLALILFFYYYSRVLFFNLTNLKIN